MRSSPPKPDALRRGATRRRTPPATPLYSECSARMAWPAIWCAITSSSPDSHRVAITGSLGAARRAASGRSRPNQQNRLRPLALYQGFSLRPSRHLRPDQRRGRRRGYRGGFGLLGPGDLDQRPQQLGDAGEPGLLVLPVAQVDDLLVGAQLQGAGMVLDQLDEAGRV